MPNILTATYEQSGNSKQLNHMGMRPMQARAYEAGVAQYLLVKAPPASGKSRALMFVGLDKLTRQGLRKVIVAVPERSIGNSFRSTNLKAHGFDRDWRVKPEWNLCTGGSDENGVGRSKVQAFKSFMQSDDEVLVCTHATLRFAFEKIGAEPFDDCLLAVDEFHHASSNDENRLGELVRALMSRDKAHIVAMTGSYFRGDSEPVLRPDDEARFARVTYTYYEQLNGYEFLKALGIGYHFYRGTYLTAIMEVLDTDKKTIIHIPNVNSGESTKDKLGEADQIMSMIGTVIKVDEGTGFILIECEDGRVLKIANLVDDDPKVRERVVDSLRLAEDVDAVDIIIALGMAKEGFDWIWCEHALTVGYRNSLTEVIQIIGRATRDAPGKAHAQFTNLIAEPDSTQENVAQAVNDMLKAISASLLMEQVLAPKFNFYTRTDEATETAQVDSENDSGRSFFDSNSLTGEVSIGIRGFAEPSTEFVKEIVENDMYDLVATVCQDKRVTAQAMATNGTTPEVISKGLIGKIVEEKYPDLSVTEQEEVRQQLVARMNIVAAARQEENDEKGSRKASILDLVKRFVNVRDVDIDLIDQVNPFQSAYEVLSRSMDAQTLAAIHIAVAAQRIRITEDEAVALWPRIKLFRAKNGRGPSLTAQDELEKRLAEAQAWLIRKKQEKAQNPKASRS